MNETEEGSISKEEIQTKLDKLEKRKKKWQYAWTEDLITDADFRNRMKEANKEEEELHLQLETENEEEPEMINKDEILNIIKGIEKNWHFLERKEKKILVNTIVNRINFHHTRVDRSWITIENIEFNLS